MRSQSDNYFAYDKDTRLKIAREYQTSKITRVQLAEKYNISTSTIDRYVRGIRRAKINHEI